MQTNGGGTTTQQNTTKRAVVVCDLQPDLLSSIPAADRRPLLDSLRICLDAARRARWTVVFTGLRFPSRYDGVDPRHRLYGGLRRLNEKMGDDAAHWFMEGHAGSDIEGSLFRGGEGGDVVVWRRRHSPPAELVTVLRNRGVTRVAVAGIRASHSVQAVCQALCDEGMSVTAVRECIGDDDPDRLDAVVTHVLPIYADVVTLSEMVDEASAGAGGVEELSTSLPEANENDGNGGIVRYVADCGRGGHLKIFASHLLRRPEWRTHPVQHWYSDVFSGREYVCPLGKKVVDFTDEPQFSRTSMYIRGREWLDEKEKLMTLTNDADYDGEGGTLMPETYVIENGRWVGKEPPSKGDDDAAVGGPWFLKEVDKNGGRSVEVYRTPGECLDNADAKSRYVAQRHVQNPLLTDDGKKCHVKFYNLLRCDEDGASWELHTCRDAFLSVSPNKWSADDVSTENQVTIARHRRMRPNVAPEGWTVWGPDMHAKCQDVVTELVRRAIERGRLSGRPGKGQFEVFSADFVFDTSGRAWIIEFNFTPVLYDPTADQELTTPGLIEYDRLYKLHGGDGAEVHDTDMIREAISIVFYPDELTEEGGATTENHPRLWNSAGKFRGGGGGTAAAAASSKEPAGGAATTATTSRRGSASTEKSMQGRPVVARGDADATSMAVMTGGR